MTDRSRLFSDDSLMMFLAAPPGLEPWLLEEAKEIRLQKARTVPGGVECIGAWTDVWRANLWLRGASRVLVRLGSFRAAHLSTLDKRARSLPWEEILTPGTPVAVEATCRGSKIYHSGAAAERVRKAAIAKAGALDDKDDGIKILVRMEKDICTVSIDTSGELLHKRGYKQSVVKAPLRETMAALFLRAAGFRGDEPLIDPMCGSGTIPLEAASWARGLAPGRDRRFAFERLASFDRAAWETMRSGTATTDRPVSLIGADRNGAAIQASRQNVERAGLASVVDFRHQPLSALERPEDPPGLVMVNPPYGERIGDRRQLTALYASFGSVMRDRFAGWRAAMITSDAKLASAAGLPFQPPGPPVPHGPLRVRLYQTPPL
ncbi:MAG: class I SAM-dependent RNA methyltransferase [Pseudomonadota bacterium]